MNSRRIALVAASIAILVVPALALAGTRPPEGANYAKTGTSNLASTHTDKDKNSKAEKVDVSIGIYKCGNQVPVSLNNLKINGKGKYSFKGKAKNLAGQKVNLVVKGEFKNKNKLVQRTTIKSGNCKKTDKVTLKRQ